KRRQRKRRQKRGWKGTTSQRRGKIEKRVPSDRGELEPPCRGRLSPRRRRPSTRVFERSRRPSGPRSTPWKGESGASGSGCGGLSPGDRATSKSLTCSCQPPGTEWKRRPVPLELRFLRRMKLVTRFFSSAKRSLKDAGVRRTSGTTW